MTRLSIWNDLRPFSVGFDDLFDHFNNTLEYRSEDRRVGKDCRYRWEQTHVSKNVSIDVKDGFSHSNSHG